MLEHLLLPIDGSSDSWIALEQALDIARRQHSTVHCLFVADVRLIEAPYWLAAPPDDPNPAIDPTSTTMALQVGKRISERGQQVLAEAEQRCQQAHVACEREYVEGIPEQVILDRAQHADLVVLGRHGEGARWAGPQLGSTFEAVIRHAGTPVLAAQAEARALNRILLAYDGSQRADDAMEMAVQLAQAHEGELILLTVDDGRPGRRQEFNQARQWLAQHGMVAKALFLKGHAAETILDTARTEACDLIVLGAYGHSRFLETFFGSTVDEVVHRAICPVLIHR